MIKHSSTILLALALLLIQGAGAAARAQESRQAEAASSAVEPLSFTLLIVGTRHFSDVDLIKKNVQRTPSMQRLAPAVSSQNHIVFTGAFLGTKEALIADIEGLSADRFDVQTRNDPARGLVITLRKMEEASP